jgi:hypothetical protein
MSQVSRWLDWAGSANEPQKRISMQSYDELILIVVHFIKTSILEPRLFRL